MKSKVPSRNELTQFPKFIDRLPFRSVPIRLKCEIIAGAVRHKKRNRDTVATVHNFARVPCCDGRRMKTIK